MQKKMEAVIYGLGLSVLGLGFRLYPNYLELLGSYLLISGQDAGV